MKQSEILSAFQLAASRKIALTKECEEMRSPLDRIIPFPKSA
jgi:hypothetical protein